MPDDETIVPQGRFLPQTLEERLTAQFYDWERRGRGWQVYEYPVELEPPFRPFLFHFAETPQAVDDGRRPTFLSSLADRFSAASHPEKTLAARPVSVSEPEEPSPEVLDDDGDLVELQISLPPSAKTAKEAAERFLMSLKYCSHPISFEVIGTEDSIVIELVCHEQTHKQVRQQLQAHFPEAVISERPGYLEGLWGESRSSVIVEFGLSHEFMLPLRTFRGFEVDPLVGTLGALADLQESEVGQLQVLLQAARYPWAESILRAVTDWEGRSFFADAPQMLALAREKVSQPLFAGVIRVAAQGQTPARAWQIVKALGGSLAQLANPTSNELLALSNEGYDDRRHTMDLLRRQTRRCGMLLNADELVSLVHLPSASVRVAKLKREERKTKGAPESVTSTGVLVGTNFHRGAPREVRLPPNLRMRHTYVVGASGTGKSNLLLSMLIQDIEQGEGVGLIDPHGDLADEVVARIPEGRLNDIILFDPSDAECPVSWNILQAHTPVEKTLLSSDMVATFRRLSTSWGDQMTSVLGNAVLAILESERGGSLLDLRRFLVDAAWRKEYLTSVQDPEVVFYWEEEFPLLAGRPQASILTRLDTLLRPRPIRAMVAAAHDRLDFRTILDKRKIFLAKLAQGAIGEENSTLLGSLLVSKFHQAALSRQDAAPERRANFFLYCDEFHNFITPSMASLLSGARKYRLGLTLAHQDLRQLSSRDAEVAAAAIANPATRICFRVSEADAKKLQESFSAFAARDFVNLGVGEAIARIERSEWDFNLQTLLVPPVDEGVAVRRREQAVRHTRAAYGQEPETPPAPEALPVPATPGPAAVRPRRAPAGLSTHVERLFLAYVGQHPGCFVTQAYKGLGLSGYKGDRIKESLLARGLVVQAETREGEGGRVAKGLTLTEAGLQQLDEVARGKGGDRHKELQRAILEQASLLGWEGKTEERIAKGSGQVDVGLEKDALAVAVEISVTTDLDHELSNLRKCLDAGYDVVIAVSEDEEFRQALKGKTRKALTLLERKKIQFVAPRKVREVLMSISGSGQRPDSGEKRVNSENRNQNRLLGVEDAAVFLDVSKETLYSWVSQRRIPFVKVGRLTKFDRERLREWLAKGTREERGER